MGPAQVAHGPKDKGVANMTNKGHNMSWADLCLGLYVFILRTSLFINKFFVFSRVAGTSGD